MPRKVLLTQILACLLAAWIIGPCPAHGAVLETRGLVVSDATGTMPDEVLQGLAEDAQHMLDRVLAFWNPDSGVDPGAQRFGKIRVVFDVPHRRAYSCVFYWGRVGGERVRFVRVFGFQGGVQMLAHKLTSAVFPQQDKLIRNMMGILAETQLGNPQTFPRCGFDSDEWVAALQELQTFAPLATLGAEHESWGMRDEGNGRLVVFDRATQHRSYAEAGSFGSYLFRRYGIDKVKQFNWLAQGKERPAREVFGASLEELEAGWLEELAAGRRQREAKVLLLRRLLKEDPVLACRAAQRLAQSAQAGAANSN